jgi:hypothetical protein
VRHGDCRACATCHHAVIHVLGRATCRSHDEEDDENGGTEAYFSRTPRSADRFRVGPADRQLWRVWRQSRSASVARCSLRWSTAATATLLAKATSRSIATAASSRVSSRSFVLWRSSEGAV